MNRIATCALITASLLLAGRDQCNAEAKRPNVLFVVSDDLNVVLSGLGHPECQTPHLDAFAQSAIAFTRAYCQFPLCGPSRASIMTGQYPKSNGVTGNGAAVREDRVTLPKHFRDQGYWTGRVGKIYHMGIPGDVITGGPGRDHAPSWDQRYNMAALETLTPGKIEDYVRPESVEAFPGERKRWREAHEAGRPYKMPKTVRGDYAVVEVADADEGLLPDWMAADKAIEVLRQRANREQPFFLAVGFVRPHFPFVSTESSLAPYNAGALIYPHSPEDDYDDIPPQAINARMELSQKAVRNLRRGYFGAVTFMDAQFGRLMTELDQLDLRKDTIVVFVSDHGYLLGEHQMWKKTKLWEEAIHVPLLISAPGCKDGSRCNRPVELIDIYPTLTELAGLPADPGVEGLSLVSLLNDPTATRSSKPDAWSQTRTGHCLRTERWAYMWYPTRRKDLEAAMLYDMTNDPQQFTNLADNPEYAAVKKRLHDRLQSRIETATKNSIKD